MRSRYVSSSRHHTSKLVVLTVQRCVRAMPTLVITKSTTTLKHMSTESSKLSSLFIDNLAGRIVACTKADRNRPSTKYLKWEVTICYIELWALQFHGRDVTLLCAFAHIHHKYFVIGSISTGADAVQGLTSKQKTVFLDH